MQLSKQETRKNLLNLLARTASGCTVNCLTEHGILARNVTEEQADRIATQHLIDFGCDDVRVTGRPRRA